MSLNRLFDTIQQLRESAHWRSAFGEPQPVGEKTIIPVASTWYGFGFGFGQPVAPMAKPGPGSEIELADGAEEAESGGGGGGAITRPVGALVVTADDVHFEEAGGYNRVALAGIGLAGWIFFQVGLTLREVFGQR